MTMGVELELLVLLAIQTVGTSVFAVFEVETPAWRKILKWSLISAFTVGAYYLAGHWALVIPIGAAAVGSVAHLVICRRWGVDPLRATPRRLYYERRGWTWVA